MNLNNYRKNITYVGFKQYKNFERLKVKCIYEQCKNLSNTFTKRKYIKKIEKI